MEVAKQAAYLLQQEFGAKRVVLFGSMLKERIHKNSDIDLAVWGIQKSDYFQAVGKLQGLSEFEIDLVEPENAPPYIVIDLIESENAPPYIVEAIDQGIDL